MKERPIIFTTESVRAILDGSKTQTRRVIKPQPNHMEDDRRRLSVLSDCSYGKVGDRLWVKETWAKHSAGGGLVMYKADNINKPPFTGWKSSRFMPKVATRIWLEITDIQIERVQDISFKDCVAEGIRLSVLIGSRTRLGRSKAHKLTFKKLWNSINVKRGYGWDTNPWVWVISFKQV